MILDTGVVYASFDRRDDWHTSSARLLTSTRDQLRIPTLILAEVCYLLGSRLGAADASVIALAERLGDQHIATTDRRHFRVVREARSFTLHPSVG